MARDRFKMYRLTVCFGVVYVCIFPSAFIVFTVIPLCFRLCVIEIFSVKRTHYAHFSILFCSVGFIRHIFRCFVRLFIPSNCQKCTRLSIVFGSLRIFCLPVSTRAVPTNRKAPIWIYHRQKAWQQQRQHSQSDKCHRKKENKTKIE